MDLFRGAPRLAEDIISRVHERKPGLLFRKGLERMGEVLARRAGGAKIPWNEVRVVTWLQQVFFPQHPDIGLRDRQEFVVIGRVIDLLLDGQLPHLGDVLLQRMKALEQKITEGSWELAQHHELVTARNQSLADPTERHLAAKAQNQVMKLQRRIAESRSSRGSG